MAAPSLDYRPRRPGQDVLYGIVRDHFETFRAHVAAIRDGAGLPTFVEAEFRSFLRCGWLAGGFARGEAGDLSFHATPTLTTLDVAAIEPRIARVLERRDAGEGAEDA